MELRTAGIVLCSHARRTPSVRFAGSLAGSRSLGVDQGLLVLTYRMSLLVETQQLADKLKVCIFS